MARYVILVGADGSGKTTQAEWLVHLLKSKGYKVRYAWIRSQHTLAYLISKLLAPLGWRRSFQNPNGILVSRFEVRNGSFAKKVWPIIEFVSVIPNIILKIKLPLLLGYRVISDRCTIDTTVSIALTTQNVNFANSFLGRLLLKMLPKERVIIFLDADASTVLHRKPDVINSINEIDNMIALYRMIAKKMEAHYIDPALKTIHQVRNEIADLISGQSAPKSSTGFGSGRDFSIIIPTIDRPLELGATLGSILEQEIPPKEVVIVDQSTGQSTSDVASTKESEFLDKKISLTYLHLDKKSSSRARNYGKDHSSGEIVFFIDDDVKLLKDYTENILKVYEARSDAVGVQGTLANFKRPYNLKSYSGRIGNHLRRAFFLLNYKQNTWKVMPSINDVFPFPLTMITPTERFQGCCSYRRVMLDSFRFDENLEGWSLLEDLDLSYRVFKSGKGMLYVTPEAKLVHKGEIHMVSSIKSESYKKIVNRTYMFFKLMEQSPRNYAIFCWSIFGYVLSTLLGAIIGRHQRNKWGSIYLITAVFSALKHLREIRQLNLQFYKSHKL